MQSDLEEQIITLEGEDGKAFPCQILGVFEFENKEYALLLSLNDEEGEDEQGEEKEAVPVLMQLKEEDGQARFLIIDNDDEFQRVSAYVRELAEDMDDEEGDEE